MAHIVESQVANVDLAPRSVGSADERITSLSCALSLLPSLHLYTCIFPKIMKTTVSKFPISSFCCFGNQLFSQIAVKPQDIYVEETQETHHPNTMYVDLLKIVEAS